jgi:hypothetical protein
MPCHHRRKDERTTSFRGFSSTPYVALKSSRGAYTIMKQIQVYPNHIRIRHLDLVLIRRKDEPYAQSLKALAKMGLDVRPENVELHTVATN